MASRQQAVNSRRLQFVFLILLVIAAVVMLANSDSGKNSVFGISMKAIYGVVGMVLIIVVAVAGQKTLFSNLPDDEPATGRDAMSKAEDVASEKGLGRLAEIKYAKRRKSGEKIPFEGLFRKDD
ncbi:MAG: hypothetical protein WCX64_00210 [Candidatus Micrarchaeia archaeon]